MKKQWPDPQLVENECFCLSLSVSVEVMTVIPDVVSVPVHTGLHIDSSFFS